MLSFISVFGNPRLVRNEVVTMDEKPSKTIENLRNLTKNLISRDTLLDEFLPQIQSLAARLNKELREKPAIPNCLSVLALKGEDDHLIPDMCKAVYDGTNQTPSLSVHMTGSVENAIILCSTKTFDVIVSRDMFNGNTVKEVAAALERGGVKLPFVILSDGNQTEEVKASSADDEVYTAIDRRLATNAQAIEIACRQSVLRYKEKSSVRFYAGEIQRLFEAMTCKIPT